MSYQEAPSIFQYFLCNSSPIPLDSHSGPSSVSAPYTPPFSTPSFSVPASSTEVSSPSFPEGGLPSARGGFVTFVRTVDPSEERIVPLYSSRDLHRPPVTGRTCHLRVTAAGGYVGGLRTTLYSEGWKWKDLDGHHTEGRQGRRPSEQWSSELPTDVDVSGSGSRCGRIPTGVDH